MKVEIIDEARTYEMYDEALDCEGTVTVAGFEMYPSNILEKCDPTAYRCGYIDYIDSLSEDGYLCEEDAEEGKDYFKCLSCDDCFDDEDEAKECCGEVE